MPVGSPWPISLAPGRIGFVLIPANDSWNILSECFSSSNVPRALAVVPILEGRVLLRVINCTTPTWNPVFGIYCHKIGTVIEPLPSGSACPLTICPCWIYWDRTMSKISLRKHAMPVGCSKKWISRSRGKLCENVCGAPDTSVVPGENPRCGFQRAIAPGTVWVLNRGSFSSSKHVHPTSYILHPAHAHPYDTQIYLHSCQHARSAVASSWKPNPRIER